MSFSRLFRPDAGARRWAHGARHSAIATDARGGLIDADSPPPDNAGAIPATEYAATET